MHIYIKTLFECVLLLFVCFLQDFFFHNIVAKQNHKFLFSIDIKVDKMKTSMVSLTVLWLSSDTTVNVL